MFKSLKEIYLARFNDKKERENVWRTLVKDYFQQFIDKEDTVLDVGCGYGDFINYVEAKKKIAIDINATARKEINKDTNFYTAKSSKMPFIKSSSVDKIFVSNLFEHLTKDQIVKTINEFRRILKIGGQVLILQPNIRFLPKDYWMFFDHITPIDDRALEEIFLSHGFRLKKRILKFLPYTTKSHYPKNSFFVRLYLHLPFLWWFLGKQSFLIFEKKGG